MTSDTESGNRPLRADAERNRARIVEAARVVFAEHGIAASLDDVARAAGVGIGTLYRRFPTKETLLSAVFDQVVTEITDLIDGYAADPDPLAGLIGLVTDVLERQSGDRGVFEICTKADFGHLDRIAEHYTPAVEGLVTRAKAAGLVRADLTGTDIAPVIVMLSAVGIATRRADPGLWRRYLALVFDGIRAPGTSELPPNRVSHTALMEAISSARL
ncbi:TetR/AcrR family transcriptional regulator [Actinokineospora globicatena]|uniref:TetR family transcriptional regulator n=1 Tax=Actinokineospora globicatena TaxID=103729 RepID=A0A9W6QUF3_9PSEU|nr:TetR/AcrR family transcriptional regulator [Actinokineospora globicatena]MCP2302207.1 transcriptional regulator, TetR family [Actinokineospora globicatena]GLW76129.1 TetR family transcriptional regulator [Actinokineospora globicatena]GLW82964.1 TetR family transcriptional regulator [Actinokineospora globicatena]GLW95742.1 TetR family transcriptional regulator [Actinokineospora globicatena]